MLDERDAKQAFAEEAEGLLPEGVNLKEMDTVYRNARALLLNDGKADENPYLLAFTYMYPDEAKKLMKGKSVSVDEASRLAAQRLEKPGPAREPQGSKPVKVELQDPNWFQAYVRRYHPGVAGK
jgi:hypothetical protein